MLKGTAIPSSGSIYEKINYSENLPVDLIDEKRIMESFRTRRMDNPNIPAHWHRSLEIIYTNRSQASLVANGEKFDLMPESVFVINSGFIHYFLDPDTKSGFLDLSRTYGYTGFSLQLNYYFVKSMIPEIDSRTIIVNEATQVLLIPVIKEIIRYFQMDAVQYKDIIAELCRTLLIIIRQFCVVESRLAMEHWKDHEVMIRLIDFIDEHYTDDINIEELAAAYHISYSHMASLFREKLGISARQYITFLRLKRAYHLLISTAKTVTEISLEAGFPNANAFITEFKKQYKITPNQFRKQVKTK